MTILCRILILFVFFSFFFICKNKADGGELFTERNRSDQVANFVLFFKK